MKKEFNSTGLCVPHLHYMVDVSGKIAQITQMVEAGKYFSINRPRQYGKTTILYLLEKHLLEKGYLPISLSFEDIDTPTYQDYALFLSVFLDKIRENLERLGEIKLIQQLENEELQHFRDLSKLIRKLAQASPKKLILLIDEVDKGGNNQLILDFLAMLRAKFLDARAGKDVTFHSVILAGLHDVRSLKLKIRPEHEAQFNSPWNIATNFDIDLSFSIAEIQTLLEEYAQAEDIVLDSLVIAEKIYFHTSGYPFLVTRICQLVAENLGEAKEWIPKDIEKAVHLLIKEKNMNFESVIHKLETFPNLYQTVYQVLFSGIPKVHNTYHAESHLGGLYGIFKNEQGIVKIQNKIYEELIYSFMSTNLKIEMQSGLVRSQFIDAQGNLDFKKVLLKFQEFMRLEYNEKNKKLLETDGRLVFLAFIQPIINGDGYAFKEVQISEEKRLDVVVTFKNQRFVAELKIWRGEAAHAEGIKQLSDYLDRLEISEGYLLIFDQRTHPTPQEQEVIQLEDKEIATVWVRL